MSIIHKVFYSIIYFIIISFLYTLDSENEHASREATHYAAIVVLATYILYAAYQFLKVILKISRSKLKGQKTLKVAFISLGNYAILTFLHISIISQMFISFNSILFSAYIASLILYLIAKSIPWKKILSSTKSKIVEVTEKIDTD